MLLKIFAGRNLIIQYAIVVVSFILIFSVPVTIVKPVGYSPLYDILYNLIADSKLAVHIVFVIFSLIPILYTQFILTFHGLIDRNNKVFLLFAPILMYSYAGAWVVSPAMVSSLFVIFGIGVIFSTSEQEHSVKGFTFAAILFAIGTMFYSANFFSVLFLILAVYIFKQFNFRDMLALITSFLLPFIYLFTFYFINNQFNLKFAEFISSFSNIGLDLSYNSDVFSTIYYVVFLIVSLFVIASIVFNQRNILIQNRKYISFLMWILSIELIMLLFTNYNWAYHFVYIMFFMSIFYTLSFANKKVNWIFEIILIFYIINDINIIRIMLDY